MSSLNRALRILSQDNVKRLLDRGHQCRVGIPGAVLPDGMPVMCEFDSTVFFYI
jgi:hypothetical protein